MDLHTLVENKCSVNEFRIVFGSRNVDEYFLYSPTPSKTFHRTIIFSAIQFDRDDILTWILNKNPDFNCLETCGESKTFAIEYAFAENYKNIYELIKKRYNKKYSGRVETIVNSSGRTIKECIEIHTFLDQVYSNVNLDKMYDIMAIHSAHLNVYSNYLSSAKYYSHFIQTYIIDVISELHPIEFLTQEASIMKSENHYARSLFRIAMSHNNIDLMKYIISKLKIVAQKIGIPYTIDMSYSSAMDMKWCRHVNRKEYFDFMVSIMTDVEIYNWFYGYITHVGYPFVEYIQHFFDMNVSLSKPNGEYFEESIPTLSQKVCACGLDPNLTEECDSDKKYNMQIYNAFKTERSKRDRHNYEIVFARAEGNCDGALRIFHTSNIFEPNLLKLIKKFL